MTKNELAVEKFDFKSYTRTKTVQAVPMSAYAAKQEGANIPEYFLKQEPSPAGYLIKHPDNYLSWSPEIVFESVYRISETYIDRMKIELEDLKNRISKAEIAVYTPAFLKPDDRRDLLRQLDYMHQYARILYERIETNDRKEVAK